jgi:hypothetical protein
LKTFLLIATLLLLQGCTALFVGGAVVGAATKVAVETAKVPVKVTGAAVDAVTDDEDED